MNHYPKIFVINLIRSVDRKKHMQQLCKKHHLNVEFIEAVDGKTLTKTQIKDIHSKKQAIKNISRELSFGEIACALSHRLIYQKMLDDDIEVALILEDDAEFDHQLLDFLPKLDCVDKNWELLLLGYWGGVSNMFRGRIKLGHNIWYQQKINNYTIRRPSQIFWGTHGYCITNNGAKKLLKHTDKLSKPIDTYTGDDKYTNLYMLENPIILLHQKLSLQNNITDRQKAAQNSFKIKLVTLLHIKKLHLKLFLIKCKMMAILGVIKPIHQYASTNLKNKKD